MPAYRIRYLKDKFGDLDRVIPEMVNQHGQHGTARLLGISTATVNKWLKDNGYRRRMVYERIEEGKAS